MTATLVPVLAGAAAHMVVGFAWYSPQLFGKQWTKLMGYSAAEIKKKQKEMGMVYLTAFGSVTVQVFVLSMLSSVIMTRGLLPHLFLAFWVWAGFIMPVQLTNVLFAGKPLKLFLIDTSYQLAGILAAAVVLWKW